MLLYIIGSLVHFDQAPDDQLLEGIKGCVMMHEQHVKKLEKKIHEMRCFLIGIYMKKLLYMSMIIFGSHIFYASESQYPVSYRLLRISYNLAMSKLISCEQLLQDSSTGLSPEKRESLERAMIYSSDDLEAYHNVLMSVLDLQLSNKLTQTQRFKASEMSEKAYVNQKIQKFREDVVLCEKQIELFFKKIKKDRE